MDDIGNQINQILSDPQSMQKIQAMMGALGLTGERQGQAAAPAASAASAPAAPAPAQVPAPAVAPPSSSNPLGALGNITPEMLQAVNRLAPLLGQVNREDDSTRLLRSLRPLLSAQRQQKLDEAIRILQMMRLMPLLKESGLFSGLLSSLL